MRAASLRIDGTTTNILALVFLTIIAGCAPNAAPTAAEAVERMLDALGSERARDNVRALRTVAECGGPDGHFVTTVTSLRPDTVHLHQQARVGDSPCLRITMTDEFGAAAAICIGQADWLPVELQLVTERDEGPIRIEFADWQVVDGINWFRAFRLTDSSDDFHYEFVGIETSSFGQETDIEPPALPRRETGES